MQLNNDDIFLVVSKTELKNSLGEIMKKLDKMIQGNNKSTDLLTVEQAAKFLGCSKSFLFTKKFPRRKLGKRVWYVKKEIEDFIKKIPH